MNLNSISPKPNNKLILISIISFLFLVIFLAFTRINLGTGSIAQIESWFIIFVGLFGVAISYLNIQALTTLHKKLYLKINLGLFLITSIFFISEIVSKSYPNFVSALIIPAISFVSILVLLIYYFINFSKYIKDDLTGKFDSTKFLNLTKNDKVLITILSILSSLPIFITSVSVYEKYNWLGFVGLLFSALFTFFKSLLYFDIRSKLRYSIYYLILLELFFSFVLIVV